MNFTFDVVEAERLPPTRNDALIHEPDEGVVQVTVNTLVPVFDGSRTADLYYKDGFAKQAWVTEIALRRRFPLSYPK